MEEEILLIGGLCNIHTLFDHTWNLFEVYQIEKPYIWRNKEVGIVVNTEYDGDYCYFFIPEEGIEKLNQWHIEHINGDNGRFPCVYWQDIEYEEDELYESFQIANLYEPVAKGLIYEWLKNKEKGANDIFEDYYDTSMSEYIKNIKRTKFIAEDRERLLKLEFAQNHWVNFDNIREDYERLLDFLDQDDVDVVEDVVAEYKKYVRNRLDKMVKQSNSDNITKTSEPLQITMVQDEKTPSSDKPKEDNIGEKEYHKGAIEDFADLEYGYWSHPYLWANGKVGTIINTFQYENYDGSWKYDYSCFRFVPIEKIKELKAVWVDYNNPDIVWCDSKHEYLESHLRSLPIVALDLEGLWLEEYIDRTGKSTADIFETFYKGELDKYLKENSIEPDAATKDYKKEFVCDFHAKYFMYNIDSRLQTYLYEEDVQRIDTLRQQYLEFVKRKAKEMYPDEENSNPLPAETETEEAKSNQNNSAKHSSENSRDETKFREYIPETLDKDEIMEKLHILLDGTYGAEVVKVLRAAECLGFLKALPKFKPLTDAFFCVSSNSKRETQRKNYNTYKDTKYPKSTLQPYIDKLKL